MESTASTSRDDVWVVVPAFNEEQVLREVITEVVRVYPNVVCVDDGSSDGSAEAARAAGAKVVRHPVNLGQGAALQTGFEYVLKDPSMRWVITFDADGQHQVSDIEKLLARAREGGLQVVFGSRFLKANSELTGFRRVVVRAGAAWTNVTTGTKLTDAHNGLRALSRDVVESIDITQNRMAHASQIVAQVSRIGVRYGECPVDVLYTDYSRAKGQSVWNAVNIVTELLSR